jgi:hypothetical protein
MEPSIVKEKEKGWAEAVSKVVGWMETMNR